MYTGITITGYIPLWDIRPLYSTGKTTLKKLSKKVLTIQATSEVSGGGEEQAPADESV